MIGGCMNKVHKTQRITFLLFKLNKSEDKYRKNIEEKYKDSLDKKTLDNLVNDLLQKELKDYLQINILIDIIFTMKSLTM